jgi:hypothetical protein
MDVEKLNLSKHHGGAEERIAWKKKMAKLKKECDVSIGESKKLKFRRQP